MHTGNLYSAIINLELITKMLFGATLGTLYACFGFNGQPPKKNCSFGPVEYGTLVLCGRDIHYWMVAAPLCVAAVFASVFYPSSAYLGCFDFASFCFVMTVHGLVFPDRCNTEMESESDSESSDIESASSDI